MKRIVHIKTSTILGILCLVICILPSTQNMKKAEAAEMLPSSVPFTSEQTALPLADTALDNTYLPYICEATLTFTLMPYPNAHNPRGIDEMTFHASYTGRITLLEYKRIFSYCFPPQLLSAQNR